MFREVNNILWVRIRTKDVFAPSEFLRIGDGRGPPESRKKKTVAVASRRELNTVRSIPVCLIVESRLVEDNRCGRNGTGKRLHFLTIGMQGKDNQ